MKWRHLVNGALLLLQSTVMIGKKIEDYHRFFTHAGEKRFTIFACKSLQVELFCDLYGADVVISTKDSFGNFGSNETMQKVLASIV